MVKQIVRDIFFLVQPSKPATKADIQVGKDLQDTLQANRERCVGMAANMIGVRKNIIIVKELELEDGHKELEKMANGYLTLLKDNGEEDALIAYGTVVHDIKEVSKSYKEAKLALDVGKIFFSERNVIAYSALGIG